MINFQHKKIIIIKILLLFGLIILPWMLNSNSENTSVPILNADSVGSYESNICVYNFYDFLRNNAGSEYEIKLDTSSSMDCHSKVNGIGYVSNQFNVYIGSNINIDFLIQSTVWLILFSFIPISKKYVFKNSKISIFASVLLFILHLRSEGEFYQLNSKTFTTDLSENYLIFSLALSMYLLLVIFTYLFQNRFYNVLNYLPLVFVLTGTYNTLNLNFFLICFSYIGITQTFRRVNLKLGLIIVLGISWYWQMQNNTSFSFFDIDKLKGFSSSSYNNNSIIYWSLIYYFFCVGLMHLYKKNVKKINLEKLKKNFLVSGALVVLLSVISSYGTIFNLLTYYYLGLNKTASKSFQSVSGNAWRGISSSAEGVGEFFAFTLLFIIGIALKNKKINLSPFTILLLLINLFGLYRANNFASIFSLAILLAVTFIIFIIKSKKIKLFIGLSIIFLVPYSYYLTSTIPSLDFLNSNLITESLNISYTDSLQKNQYGQTPIDEGRFLEVIQMKDVEKNISSSLEYLVTTYHFSERNALPNLTSIISAVAYPINRSEKWGIFFAKYNPSFESFLFGSGINQLGNYYLDHPTKSNTGLVLPHSSLFSYLVYVGIFGLLIILCIFIYKILTYKSNHLYIVFLVFLILNLIKSDSILYINNFILIIFILQLHDLSELRIPTEESREEINSE